MAVKGAASRIEDTALCSCNLSAKVKVRTEGGWENMCFACYYRHHYRQSVEYCNALGLTTTAQRIAWLQKHGRGMVRTRAA